MKIKFFLSVLFILVIYLLHTDVNCVKNNYPIPKNLEMEDFIEYISQLKRGNNRNSNNRGINHKHNTVSEEEAEFNNFLETNSVKLIERGKGCESLNKCSGKGTCSNGVCTCDDGFDYFDCSQNTSKDNLIKIH